MWNSWGVVDFSLSSEADLLRATRLRKMKLVALSLLVLAAVIYLATLRLDHSGVWGFVNSGAEAAMVGALADWFAVTALFRHPLGVKIPHTAIIPRKKDDLARSLQEFFAENFLTEDVIRGRIADAGIAAQLGAWLVRPENTHRTMIEVVKVTRAGLDRIDADDVRSVAEDAVIPRLIKQPLSPPLGRLLDAVVHDNSHKGLVDLAVNELGRWLLANPQRFVALLGERAPRWAPEFVNGRVINWAYHQSVEWLIAVRNDPQHPARKALDSLLLRVAADMQTDSAVQQRTEALKERLLTHPATGDTLVTLWNSLRASLEEALDDETSPLWQRAEAAISRLGASLESSPALQHRVDTALADLAAFLVRSYGRQLSTVISHTIERWDGQEASRKIELHVGRDLQFIRINGTIVGALAGLIIHSVSLLVR